MKKTNSIAKFIKDTYLSNTRRITSSKLRAFLIQAGMKDAACEICGLAEWQGMPMPLELHHKNGNHADNSESNVMILCPNCHAQITRHITD